jgi:hypothetical protein
MHEVDFLCSDGKRITVTVRRRWYMEDGEPRCEQTFSLPDSVTPDDIEALRAVAD